MGTKKNITWCQELAAKRGGKCLSVEYTNAITKHKWQCDKGHQWTSKPNDIQQGHWCPHCAGKARHDLEWCRGLASAHCGECLSLEYINVETQMQWMCRHGHVWSAPAGRIKSGVWCLVCSGSEKHTIEQCRELAQERGGECLSEVYVNGWTKIKWRCNEGHEWEASFGNVGTNGSWCPHCANRVPHGICWLRELAKSVGGLCLSTEYENMLTKYRWQCNKGHQWTAKANCIQQGRWCPICSGRRSKKELKLLAFAKSINQSAVGSVKGVLKNTSRELDIYIPSLRKAIEFDGTFWHKSEWALNNDQTARDARKDQECREAGIELLRIDEVDFDRDPDAIFEKVRNFLGDNHGPQTDPAMARSPNH